MPWWEKVRARGFRHPILHLEPGEHLLQVVEEPERPVATRYGLRLPLTVRPSGSGDLYTWLVPFRDEVGDESLLGQLRAIAESHGGLRGLTLRVRLERSGVSRRYGLEVVGDAGGRG